MKLLRLPLDTLFIRFYLMMAIVLIAGFTGIWILAFLALPVVMSCLMGVRFGGGAHSKVPGDLKDLGARKRNRIEEANQSAA